MPSNRGKVTALVTLALAIEVGIQYGVGQGVVAFIALTALRSWLLPKDPGRCESCQFYREHDGGRMVCFRFTEPIVGGYHEPESDGFCSCWKERK